jgi:polysaccharide deacetylase family protein (PEP-CTERM system associated)
LECLVINSITCDVEEWFHVCAEIPRDIPLSQDRVVGGVERLLSLLAAHGARGTFFLLGCVAEAHPELAPRIARAGHELASHGWSHTLVTQLKPGEFRDELRRTNALIAAQTGVTPRGYRAPRWSLSRHGTPWAFEILVEEGFVYDASCTPLAGIGDPRGSRVPVRMMTAAGPLWEIPPLVTPMLGVNLPTGGGWGFRFFPLPLIARSIRGLNHSGHPAVLFVHPRELDPAGPRLPLPRLQSFVTYGSRRDAAPRLARLLRDHRFAPLLELVRAWAVA